MLGSIQRPKEAARSWVALRAARPFNSWQGNSDADKDYYNISRLARQIPAATVARSRPMSDLVKERFMGHVSPEPMSGCWLWMGYACRKGYGLVRVGGKLFRAHRMSWMLHKGDIASNEHVLHKCDIPSCVNPSHLFLGNNFDNMKDAAKKKRLHLQKNPELSPTRVLTREQVIEIRDKYKPGIYGYKRLAKDYGVHSHTVRGIILRKRWTHI